MKRRGLLLIALGMLAAACGSPTRNHVDQAAGQAGTAGPGSRAGGAAEPTAASRPRVVALGDSLTAGLGLSPDQAWPALVQEKIDEAGLDVEVVNAGVSGDTTAGGLRRLDWALDGDVKVLVLELGANDGLRGLPVEQMRNNLSQIIATARDRDIAVLLCGMEAPPNFGPEYTREFRQVYRDLADRHDVAFVPFFLDGIAGSAALNQADGIHPNEEGTRRVADLVWRSLQPLLTRALATS
jgi:acyl-CoA thioesterase-1